MAAARPKSGAKPRGGTGYLIFVAAGIVALGVFFLTAERGLASRVSALELAECSQSYRFAATIQRQGAQGSTALGAYLAAVEEAGFAQAKAEAAADEFNAAFAARAQREGLDFAEVIRNAIEETGATDITGEPGPLIARLQACEALRENKSWLQSFLGR